MSEVELKNQIIELKENCKKLAEEYRKKCGLPPLKNKI